MQEVTRCIAALERDLFCVASTGVLIHTFLVVSSAAIMICLTYFTVHVRVNCSLTSTSGQLGNDHLTTSSSLRKLRTSFPGLSAMSSSRRSPMTLSPGFTSGDYDTNLVTSGLGILEIGARQLNDWRLHEPPPLPSLLPTRCPFQHAYIIARCHVITSDYLGGTQAPQS